MQSNRGRGNVSIPYLLTIGVAVLLTVLLIARQVTRAATERIVVARTALQAGAKVDPSQLGTMSVPKGSIPPGAVLDPRSIIGHILQRPVAEGRPVTATDFVSQTPVMWLSDEPPQGRVIVTVSVPGTLLPVRQLRTGDQFDVLAVSQKGESRVVARDAYLLGSIMGSHMPGGNTPESLLPQSERHPVSAVVGLVLAVRPQDASPIAAAQGTSDRLSFVLHGSKEILSGRLLDVPASSGDPSGQNQVELITGSKTEKVDVN